MNIAFLTSYNSDFIKKEFDEFIKQKKRTYSCWWNGYSLQEQSIYDLNSGLYSILPNVIVIHYEIESLLGDFGYNLLSLKSDEREAKLDEVKSKIRLIVNTLLVKFPGAKIVFENFIGRSESTLNALDTNIQFGFTEIVVRLNSYLFDLKREFNERFIINDYASFVSKYGNEYSFDSRLYRLAKYPFARKFQTHLINHFYSKIDIIANPRKKCLVIDLDNTLWGGIVGQDGMENIQLGSVGLGEAYVQFQKSLLAFYHAGIFLAICSKNNLNDAMEVIEKHPDMILRKKYFSSIKINWIDKATNLKNIAAELNIGTDALVFIDDNPSECELVRQQMPEVEVINLTGDPDNYINQLINVNSLQSVSLTAEDISRNMMQDANQKRKELEESVTNLDEYLDSLEMQAFITVNNESQISRISQLTQKTNQFNLTTKRYSNEEVKAFVTDAGSDVYTLRLVDKYGDNGIVLVAIIKKNDKYWVLDTFLMSCRVIGRQAETALLNAIYHDMKLKNVVMLKGEFIATSKNAPASNFFLQHGFSKVDDNMWNMIQPFKINNHFIKIIRD